ncbi:MAG: hypothetical protein NTY83_01245 [Candidatus Micrarchaeota archaeon]|nr:hypothetical protein [Candidatus Micrarchaeota archaeon]
MEVSDENVGGGSIQHNVSLNCSDARGKGRTDAEASDTVIRLYQKLGIKVIMTPLISAGVFATGDVKSAIKRAVQRVFGMAYNDEMVWAMKGERPAQFRDATPLETVIQVNSHADVRLAPGAEPGKVVYSKKELLIEQNSPVNCGMGHADDVYDELLRFVIDQKLRVAHGCKVIDVNSDDAMLTLLREVYGFDGYDPEEFIRPISDHPRHVTKQMMKIREMIDEDFQLRNANIIVNMALNNYRDGNFIRIDGNSGVYTAMDDIAALNAQMLALVPDSHSEKLRRVTQQAPEALLLCPPNISHPRNTLVSCINAKKAREDVLATPGSVFAVSGYDNVGTTYPFGPYRMLAIFYAVAHLKIRDAYLMGEGEGDVRAMQMKIAVDPIVSKIIEHYGVRVHPLTASEAQNRARQSMPPEDKILNEAMREGIRVFARKLPPQSPLNQLRRISVAPNGKA